jgi:hypothetical protein
MDWKIPYTIRKLLELRYLKWVCMTHLDIWNTSYDQEKGRKSNRQFDSWPLKVENCPDFLMCRWCATYYWKAFDKGYKFDLNFISIKGLHIELWAFKVVGPLTVGISGLPFGRLRTKCHLGASLVAIHIIYYKREGGGFPQVRAVVSLMSLSLHMACPNTKCALTMH